MPEKLKSGAVIGNRRTDAVAFNRLNLIFGLSGTVINAETAAEKRFAAREKSAAVRVRRVSQSDARTEISFFGFESRLIRVFQTAVFNIK